MIADIIAKDSADSDVLCVKVKASVLSEDAIAALLQDLRESVPTIPFSMIVGLNVIRIVRHGESDSSTTLVSQDVFGHYDPRFAKKRIFHDYLEALVEAWLSDVADHWKTDNPPGSKALYEMGLLDKLAGGRTLNEVDFAGGSLR